ncbi:hypothetical protein H9L39_17723 [Fusarium oxysporum f. sp. albedinis]|nr:hypothetical protein H9L39_17723 [Fusarium oxysporum f. sp. albedinis]
MDEINWHDLPATFQDAVTVCRSMDIRYLWIDSLCILQHFDDITPDELETTGQDFAQENSTMSRTYQNSHFTISADLSTHMDSGIFSKHPVDEHRVEVTTDDGNRAFLYIRQDVNHYGDKTPSLERRGWTLQEFLLPPRVLHFGVFDIEWRCKTRLTCECGHLDREHPPQASWHRHHFIEEATKHPPDDPEGALRWWEQVVHNYTSRQLTNSSDKLPALSGLAQQRKQVRGGVYLAGLWQDSLFHDLCWYHVLDYNDVTSGGVGRRPAHYRAPSWSWASVNTDSGCSWWWSGAVGLHPIITGEEPKPACIILNSVCEPATSDPTGEVQSGFLDIKVALIPAEVCRDSTQRVVWTIGKVESSLPLQFFKPDCELEDDGLAIEDRVFCAPIAEALCSTGLRYGCLVLKQLDTNTYQRIASLIKSKYANQSGIVYTVSRKNAEKVAESLSIQGITARHYHAGLDPQEKVEVQTSWQQGQVKIVVATIAFGMGIDKPDVRFVIHHGLPKTLEGYYQETGRAGRDGDPSDCILFYGKQGIRILKKLIADGEGNNEQKERQMTMLNRVTAFCDNKSDCRRVEILRYFGEDFSAAQCRKTCDNCKAGLIFEQREFSEYAIAAIRVVQAQRRITAVQCADILLGRKYPPYEARRSDDWYGMAKSLKNHELARVLDKLLAEKAFHENNQVGHHGMAIQYLKLGSTYRLFLSGQRKLMLSGQVPEEGANNKPSKPRSKQASKKPKDQDVTAVPSPDVSLHVGRRSKRSRTVESDDENGALALDGYANDGIMVNDNGDEEAFEKLPGHQPLKPLSRSPGLPRSISAELEVLNEIHRVDGFVQEAKVVEEKIRKRKGLRSPLFTEKELQVMAIQWTTSLDKMSKIPGIQPDKVMIHGPEILLILWRYYSGYRKVMDPKRSRGNGLEIVDLLSSDVEMSDDAYEDEDGEGSPYFNTNKNADIRASPSI